MVSKYKTEQPVMETSGRETTDNQQAIDDSYHFERFWKLIYCLFLYLNDSNVNETF